MQRERSILESFPDNIDLNQGSISHNAAMDRSAAWDNLLNPVESRLSSYSLSSGEGSTLRVDNASHNGRTLGGWDPGESSSGSNIQSQLNVNDLKVGPSWSSSLNNCVMTDGRSADWKFERPDPFLHESISSGYDGNHSQRPLSLHHSISGRSSLNATISGGIRGNGDDSWLSRGSGIPSNSYRPDRSQMNDFPARGETSDNVGTYSGSSGYMVQHHDGSGSSSNTWGLSCKRKAVEGNPARPCSSGNLSMDPQGETVGRHTLPSPYNASSSLDNISALSVNLHGPSHPGHLNPRTGSGIRGGNYGFHPSSVNEVAESSERSFSFRTDLGQHEPVPFDSSAGRSDARNPGVSSIHLPSRVISTTESPDSRAPFPRPLNLNTALNQSHMMQVPGSARSLLPFSRNGAVSVSSGASLNPTLYSGERGAALRDEATFRSSQINHPDSSFVPPAETMNMVQEPTSWSFSRVNTSSSRNTPSSSRATSSSSSSSRLFPTVWMPHQNPAAHNQQRLAEFPPWTLFPPVEPEPGGHRGHFSFFPSASSSSEEAVMSSGSSSGDHNHPYPRSLLMEVSSDDVNGWRAVAAPTERRHRIASEIRQVLSAMRRAENLRAEDYMMFDPFIIGAAELHDRHRDMRLDVDNMSYEELLALEERIGNVSTGLSEDDIMQSIRQRKHLLFAKASSNPEPCCVCQEDYIVGDDIGVLDCGHEFHTNCIKQWLTVKNLCPICKMTGLET